MRGPLRLIDRYLTREFAASALTALIIVMVVVEVVDLWERMDTYLDHRATVWEVARFHAASLPYTATISIPISILLGAVFSLGRLARRNELAALRSAGVSLPRLLAPLLVVGFLASLGSLAFNESVVPRANQLRDSVYDHEIQGIAPPPAGKRTQVSYLGKAGRMYQIQEYDVASRTMHEVTIYEFQESRLVRRLDAREAGWDGTRWVFRRGFRRTFGPEGQEAAAPFDSLVVKDLAEQPADFEKGEDDPERMGYLELRRHVQRMRASGSDARRFEVEMGSRLALPFANFIVLLLGGTLAARPTGTGTARGFGVGLGVAFLYYGLLRLSQTLGSHTGLSPLLAPWVPNVVFAAVGLWLLSRLARE